MIRRYDDKSFPNGKATILYTCEETKDIIGSYIENGGKFFEIGEGSLGYGTAILLDLREPAQLKSIVIQEVALNGWSSAHKIRRYNKLPKKYMDEIIRKQDALLQQ